MFHHKFKRRKSYDFMIRVRIYSVHQTLLLCIIICINYFIHHFEIENSFHFGVKHEPDLFLSVLVRFIAFRICFYTKNYCYWFARNISECKYIWVSESQMKPQNNVLELVTASFVEMCDFITTVCVQYLYVLLIPHYISLKCKVYINTAHKTHFIRISSIFWMNCFWFQVSWGGSDLILLDSVMLIVRFCCLFVPDGSQMPGTTRSAARAAPVWPALTESHVRSFPPYTFVTPFPRRVRRWQCPVCGWAPLWEAWWPSPSLCPPRQSRGCNSLWASLSVVRLALHLYVKHLKSSIKKGCLFNLLHTDLNNFMFIKPLIIGPYECFFPEILYFLFNKNVFFLYIKNSGNANEFIKRTSKFIFGKQIAAQQRFTV